MFYVYLLQSQTHLDQNYIGFTSDFKKRLLEHNNGNVTHTAKYKPWKLISCIAVDNKEKAISLEKFLKSGSGRLFMNKYLK